MKAYYLPLVALLGLLACRKEAASPAATASLTGKTAQLVFEEQFNGAIPNPAQWAPFNGPATNGLWRPEAVTVENGSLVITAQGQNGQVVSGGLTHALAFTYGRVEFLVRTDEDPSQATSAVVLLGLPAETRPHQAELSLYQTGSTAKRTPFYTNLHYGADSQQVRLTHWADGTQWQLMTMEWKPDTLRISRNNQLVATITDKKVIPQVAYRVGLRLDALRPALAAPVRMYVDYIRIYQYK